MEQCFANGSIEGFGFFVNLKIFKIKHECVSVKVGNEEKARVGFAGQTPSSLPL
jgi:hypothetical protein